MAVAYLWTFEVAPGRTGDFERVYGPDGDWARLFARSAGYLGTELLKDSLRAGRYLTIDRWTSGSAFEAFKQEWKAEYAALDQACEALTVSETPLSTLGFDFLP